MPLRSLTQRQWWFLEMTFSLRGPIRTSICEALSWTNRLQELSSSSIYFHVTVVTYKGTGKIAKLPPPAMTMKLLGIVARVMTDDAN